MGGCRAFYLGSSAPDLWLHSFASSRRTNATTSFVPVNSRGEPSSIFQRTTRAIWRSSSTFLLGVERQPIYAATGVPEVWKYRLGRVISLHRTAEGAYVASQKSLAFPNLPMGELNRCLQTALEKGQSQAIAALRQWLRSR